MFWKIQFTSCVLFFYSYSAELKFDFLKHFQSNLTQLQTLLCVLFVAQDFHVSEDLRGLREALMV